MVFESDSQMLINALNSSLSDSSYVGLLVEDYKSLAKGIRNCIFVFVKRSANQSAHRLAKEAGSVIDSVVWSYMPHLVLFNVLFHDFQ